MNNNEQQQPFYGPLIQDKPGEPVLSQRRDLLEQPLDFMSRMSFLPLTQSKCQSTTGKPGGLVVFCFIDMVQPTLSNH